MRVAEQGVTQRKFLGLTGNVWTLLMLGIGAVLTTADFILAFYYTPIVFGAGVGGSKTIGGIVVSQQLLFSQKIFYFHVPVAIGSFLVFTFAAAYALLFLMRKEQKYDIRSRIGMEVTLLLVMLTLITGDIWTRFEWGVWWAFGEPRLTTYAIMALLVVAYFVLRAAVTDDERRASYAAVFCIIAWIDAPISFLITRLIPTSIHPVVLRSGGGLTGTQLLAFLLGLFGMLFTSWAIYQLRLREEFAKVRIDALKEALEG
jgi:heme exporter protein C